MVSRSLPTATTGPSRPVTTSPPPHMTALQRRRRRRHTAHPSPARYPWTHANRHVVMIERTQGASIGTAPRVVALRRSRQEPEIRDVYAPRRARGTTATPSGRRYARGPVLSTTSSSTRSPIWSSSQLRCRTSRSSIVADSLTWVQRSSTRSPPTGRDRDAVTPDTSGQRRGPTDQGRGSSCGR